MEARDAAKLIPQCPGHPRPCCLAPNVSGVEVEKYGFRKALGGQFLLFDRNAEFPRVWMGSLVIKSLIRIGQGMWQEAQFLGFLVIFGTGYAPPEITVQLW